MTPRIQKLIVAVLVLVTLATATWGFRIRSERARTAAEIDRLRDELFQARGAADLCQSSLANREASLIRLRNSIDSLKRGVDSLETMDSRGVPEDEYEVYMEFFDSYNDSVAVWDTREERLREIEDSCRATIEGHNALTDSLREVLVEAGIPPG